MGRMIGSVIAGYVVMFALLFIVFSMAYLALGVNRVFQPGSWSPAGSWIALTIAVGLVAAVIGGYLCAAIARDYRGPLGLVGLVIVLGLLSAIPAVTGGDPAATTPRPETVSMFEAMSNAAQPAWVAFLNPVLGAVGVLAGARMRGSGAT